METLDDAAGFLSERGMLTRTADCSLPSLFGACHEEPAAPGRGGFGDWPKTKWILSFRLGLTPGTVVTKLHRGKTLYLSERVARLFDPLCRQAITAADADEAALLRHLDLSGPATLKDLELELGWGRARLRRARQRLERSGALLGGGLVFEDAETWYLEPLRKWDLGNGSEGTDPHADVLVAGVRAAVVAPEAEVARWFSWRPPPGTIDRLVGEGRLKRPAPGWLASPS